VTFSTFGRASVLVVGSALCLLGWLWVVPAVISPSTYGAVVFSLIGATVIAVTTWRSAQATGSTAQLLHATEATAGNVEVRSRLNPTRPSETA
jgi:hypothetical protein